MLMDNLIFMFGELGRSFFWESIAALIVITSVMGFAGVPLWTWTLLTVLSLWGFGASASGWWVFGVIALILNVPPIRRVLISSWVMKLMKAVNFLPVISETEQTAIEAGTVWVEGELFSGKPDLGRLNREPYPELTEEEQAFLDGPVEEVCGMVDEWEIGLNKDLPESAWNFLKEHGFFGMVIPKSYGGLEFSALANSAVVGKLGSRSNALAVAVMVPNSLGPAELLLHYGTDGQKAHYLPRLARGEEIPCFALTEPHAGSDAGSIRASGVVFKGEDGELYLRLNWEKRYITLASASTLLGLAFKLKDPDDLLGRGMEPGITCALIPSNADGVSVDKRHDPLGVPFINSPTTGEDVIVPVDAIIGGADGVGNGWFMLMESLAAGRGISLPAVSTMGAKLTARIAGAHATVRKQFNLSIGRFEGIEELLARIGGMAYLMEAARRYTCGGLDSGAKPAVVTAMVKYNLTEMYRKVVTDGMDILGGNAIMCGPRNLMANQHKVAPVNITVEGANILTRTLIIFGQGAIRCHPYIYAEVQAAKDNDVVKFDRAFWAHVGHVFRNLSRAKLLTISRGYFASSPVSGPAARYHRKLAWASAVFATIADFSLGMLGGQLKRREKITGRFADIFSWMYIGTAVLRRFEAEGRAKEDLPFLHWSMQFALAQIQESFLGLFRNLKLPGLDFIFRGPLSFKWRINPIGKPPSDILGGQVARVLQIAGSHRDSLTEGVYIPEDANQALGRLEQALKLCCESEPIERRLRDAVRAGQLPRATPEEVVAAALAAELITREEAEILQKAEIARDDAIQVDSFPVEAFQTSTPSPPTEGVRGAEREVSGSMKAEHAD